MEKPDPTLPQNPHKLTVRQHIYPRSVIAGFCNGRNLVEVHAKGRRPELLGPDSKVFVTQRKWDQHAEKMLAEVDRNFAAVAQKCVTFQGSLPPGENDSVTVFYASWRARWYFSQQPYGNAQLNGVAGVGAERSQDFQEKTESMGVVVPKLLANGQVGVSLRSIYGGQLQMLMDEIQRQLEPVQWRSRHFPSGTSLLVPDVCPIPYIPIGPNRCLYGYRAGDEDYSAETLNKAVLQLHKRFYFCNPPQ